MASSLFHEVYARMPNDTDFTVWKAAGMEGVNFAFIGGAERYHTAQDDFEGLDPASVQHEGESALAMVSALALDPPRERTGDAVYFDLFGAVLARYPSSLALPFALSLLLLHVAATAVRLRRGRLTLTALAVELCAWAFALLLAVAVALGMSRAELTSGAPFGPHVTKIALVFALTGLACAGVALSLASSLMSKVGKTGKAGKRGSAFKASPAREDAASPATWLGFLAVGVAAGALVPGASYLFCVPGAAAAAVELVRALTAREPHEPREPRRYQGTALGHEASSLLPVAALVVVWAPVFSGVMDALGAAIPVIFAVIGAIAGFPVLSLLRPRAHTRSGPRTNLR